MTRFNINWTAKTLRNLMEKGKINFDNAIQRSLVWDNERKSLLIHSMIYGFAIPAMYFTRQDGIYDSLDGKQRSNAIAEYLNDEFPLSVNTPTVFDDDGQEEDISGMTFSQLPEWAQDRVKDYNLTIYYYEGMTEEEAREFFRRLNNGKPLTSVEITRVQTTSLRAFQELARHEAIQAVVTDSGKKRFTDEMITMQIYHLATEENPDFGTKSFREWARETEVDPAVVDDIKNGLNALNSFYNKLENKKIMRTIKTRTHFVSAAYYCYEAVRSEKSQDEINSTLTEFFGGEPTTNEDYNKTVGAGSAKPTAVKARRNVMRSLAEKFVSEEDEGEETKDYADYILNGRGEEDV